MTGLNSFDLIIVKKQRNLCLVWIYKPSSGGEGCLASLCLKV